MFTLSKGFVDNPLYFLSDNTTWWHVTDSKVLQHAGNTVITPE
jgi:hypothetical protein